METVVGQHAGSYQFCSRWPVAVWSTLFVRSPYSFQNKWHLKKINATYVIGDYKAGRVKPLMQAF